MSIKNRRNEYNRLVKEGREKDISPRLMEEFGKEKTTGKGKDKETVVVENTDDLEE